MIMYFHFLIVSLLFTIIIPYCLRKEIGNVGALLWAYCLFSAAWVSFSQWYDPSAYIHFSIVPIIRDSAKQSLWLLFCVPLVVIFFRNKLLNIIKIGMVLNAFSVFCLGYGMFNAGTFDAGVMAAGLPLFMSRNYKKINFIAATFVLGAIISTKSATGALVLLVVAISYMTIWKSYLYAVGAALFSFGVSFWLQGSELFNDSGRLTAWKNYLAWWLANADKVFGTGVSTFNAISGFIVNGNGTIFLWAHNDWLQLLFDAGIIGLVLGLCYYFSTLYKVRKNAVLFSSLAGFGACALTYSPLHFAFSQMMCGYLFVKAEEYAKGLSKEGYRPNKRRVHLW